MIYEKTGIKYNQNNKLESFNKINIDSLYNFYDEKYWLSKDTIYKFPPIENGLNFSGKIFILQNEKIYSSAMTLSSMALKNNQIITIGQTSGHFTGYGLGTTPSVFMLPNSKLLFRMATSVDFSVGVENFEQLNSVNSEIHYDYKYVNNFVKAYNRNSRKFLFEKDSYFRKAIQYNKDN